MEEIWKDIIGFESLYKVSNSGNVKNKKEKIKKTHFDKDGYVCCTLYKNGKAKNVRIHRLVAEAFIPNPENKPIVNHKDENKQNNYDSNLEWCDVNYNNRYSKAKKVLQFDLNGNFIKEWECVRDIVRELGFNIESITGCCSKKYKKSNGYIWRYKNASKIFKLCYIDGNKAWFTNDFEHQSSDDWDDKPYEHNAEPPSDYWSEMIEDNPDCWKRKWIHHPIMLKTLYFETNDWSERRPCDGYSNSPYSVDDINKGAIAWLHTDKYNIQAGTTMKDFIDIVIKNGGTIWKKI